jgi:hypothetical protein
MEISEHSLRHMVREVDDLHREGMRTVRDEIAALHTGAANRVWASSRRRFIRDAGAGLALVIGGTAIGVGTLASPASAAGLTDQDIAKFAESVELAVVAVYNLALKGGKLHTPAVIATATTFASHHTDHAKAFGAFAGDIATAKPNLGVLAAVSDEIQEAPDETHVLSVAFDTENAAAATYLYAIGLLQGAQILGTTASILPVEAQHAAALGYVLGKDPDTDADYLPPFQTTDDELTPAKYPVAG